MRHRAILILILLLQISLRKHVKTVGMLKKIELFLKMALAEN